MDLPRKIVIGFQEGTCPLRCNKCLGLGKGAIKEKKICKMPVDKAKALIDEIAEMEKTPIVQPHIYAEPLTNPDLREIIRYCNEQNVAMSIITNGILMDDGWIDFFIENMDPRYTISFSLDAVTQGTYEIVRGKYELAQIEGQIGKLLAKRNGRGPRVTVNFTVEEDNDKETLAFIEKWKYRADGVRATIGVDADRRIPLKYRQSGPGIKTDAIKCGYLDECMAIDADGHVRVCTFDAFGETDFGNVFEKGILGIWNGEEMSAYKALQAQYEASGYGFCAGCEAGTGAMRHRKVTEGFVINEGEYAIYYNMKERYDLTSR